MSDDDQNRLKNMHKSFYDNVKENVKGEFYTDTKPILPKKFNYKKFTTVQINEYKINYKKKRDKYQNI
jgi:hypothetical protein